MSKTDNENQCEYEEESFLKYLFYMCKGWLIVILEVHILIGFILLVLSMFKAFFVFS